MVSAETETESIRLRMCLKDENDNDNDDDDENFYDSYDVDNNVVLYVTTGETGCRITVVTDDAVSSLLPYICRRIPPHHYQA